MFDILRLKYKLYKFKKYTKRKLSYHEAGHLVFGYLFGFPSKSILVNYEFENGIQIENGYAKIDLKSNSQVEHKIPNELKLTLDSLVLKRRALTELELTEVFKYLIVLLSGIFTQKKFEEIFFNNELEEFEQTYGQNRVKSFYEDDINRYNLLTKSMFDNIESKRKTFERIKKIIIELLEDKVICLAITEISKNSYKYNFIKQDKIEKILNEVKFLEYCKEKKCERIKF